VEEDLSKETSGQVRSDEAGPIDEALLRKHFWSPSYVVMSWGGARLETIGGCIRNQQSPDRNAGRPVLKPFLHHRRGLSSHFDRGWLVAVGLGAAGHKVAL